MVLSLKEMAGHIQDMKIAIIGGGITGVTTGLALQEAGHAVSIYSRDPFEKTTSFAAGAVIYPVACEESDRVLRWFQKTHDILKSFPAAEAGISEVNWRKCSVQESCDVPFWIKSVAGAGVLKPEECPYNNRSGIFARLFCLDVDSYSSYMLQRFQKSGGSYEILNVSNPETLSGDVVINCTGVYASKLFDDTDIHPARGQIVIVKNPGITDYYSTFDSKNYIYPRGERCLLGGSFDEGAWDTTPNPELTQQILRWAENIDQRFQGAEIVDVRVGLRPLRSKVRLETDVLKDGRTLIHNYGHGGSGYALSWGCARDVEALIK